MDKCRRCGKEYIYSKELRKKGYRKELCNSCSVTEARKRRKLELVEYKGGKCEKCGYDTCIDALEFHHIDPANKSFGIGTSGQKSWKIMVEEVDKCILVCANCHRKIHSK